MKMKYYAALFFATTLLMTACKKEETTETTTETAVTTTEQATPSAATPAQPTMGTAAPVTSVMYQNGSAPQQNMTATQQTTTVQSVQPAKVAPGMNPAHGQAGHRCDIAVGAPLNSAPNKPMTTTTTQNPATITQMPAKTTTTTSSQSVPSLLSAPATTVTAPGMNPPHGQEGHKCEVAVGAPLPK